MAPGRAAHGLGARRRPAIPYTLLADARRRLAPRLAATVDAVLVGADRIAANGDTANKIGTYPLAVARRPPRRARSTSCAPRPVDLDGDAADGAGIPIEMRPPTEVTRVRRAAHRAARGGRVEPVVRRHAGGAHHGDRHRGRASCGRRTGRRSRPRSRRARRAAPRRRRAGRPRGRTRPTRRPDGPDDDAGGLTMATRRRSAGRATRSSPGRRPTGRSCAPSSSATGCSPPTRSATSTTASSPGPAGASRSRATSRSRSSSSTPGCRPSRSSSMGETTGIAAILRDVIRPRAAYVAVLPGEPPGRRGPLPRRARARRWSGCGSTGPRSGRTRPRSRRLLPVEIGDLNRLYQLGFAAWLPSSAIAEGVYYGIRVGGRLVAAAGTHVVSPRGAPRRRRQRPDPRRLPRPRLRDRGDRRRHRRAAAVLRPGGAQRPRRQPAGAPGLPPARLPRARPLRGAARPPARRRRWPRRSPGAARAALSSGATARPRDTRHRPTEPPDDDPDRCRPTTSPTSAWPTRASAGSSGPSARCPSSASSASASRASGRWRASGSAPASTSRPRRRT